MKNFENILGPDDDVACSTEISTTCFLHCFSVICRNFSVRYIEEISEIWKNEGHFSWVKLAKESHAVYILLRPDHEPYFGLLT